MKTLFGPFSQLLPMTNLPLRGPLSDHQLVLMQEAGILVESGYVLETGPWNSMIASVSEKTEVVSFSQKLVGIPGMIDAHTHICFAGSRAMDYAERNAGTSYLEIAKAGGGILSTVRNTRNANREELVRSMNQRLTSLFHRGITTVEVKSGYGLSVQEELKLLRAIQDAGAAHEVDVIPTCLAAHMVPHDFEGDQKEYLELILSELLPVVQQETLASRFDIFIEQSAFSPFAAKTYLMALASEGFDITVHGDQFTTGGSQTAIDCGAISVDHLEASTDAEIDALSQSTVIPVALPGASLGLGCGYAPARKLLNAGCSLAIASDWNPGSAPQGHLLLQASLLAASEKLSTAETLAGITVRAAAALGAEDRGEIRPGALADITLFPTNDYREILYLQGMMNPAAVIKRGELFRF